ncbi:MAG: hypothetical protein HY721_19280 [Planctomycetes bacterium]|nr:hypothetical protein [Planctomycetota bacterium]
MLALPRHPLSLPRAIACALALCVAWSGLKDLVLSIRCWSPVEVSARGLAERAAGGLVWARVTAVVAADDAMLLTTATGNGHGAWLALTDPADSGVAVAVAAGEDLGDLDGLDPRRGPVAVEGLARPPGSKERGKIASYLKRLRLRSAGEVPALEVGRRPPGLLGAAMLLLGGALAAAAAFLGLELPVPPWLRDRLSWRARAQRPAEPHALPPIEDGPLPEEVKVEVRQMLDKVWSGVD